MSTEFLQTGKASVSVWILVTVEIRDVWEHAEGNKCPASGAHGRGGSHHARLPLFFMEAMLGSHQACCWQLAVLSSSAYV